MQKYISKPLYKKTVTVNTVGERTYSYANAGNIYVWLSESNYQPRETEGYDYTQVNYIGLIKPTSLTMNIGDKIDNKYEILHILRVGKFIRVDLKEIQ